MTFKPHMIGAHKGITGSYFLYSDQHKYYLRMDGTYWFVYKDYDPCFWRHKHEEESYWLSISNSRTAQEILHILSDSNDEDVVKFYQLFSTNLRTYKLEQLGI